MSLRKVPSVKVIHSVTVFPDNNEDGKIYIVDYFLRSELGMSPDMSSNIMNIGELVAFLQGAQ
jgi:hypothetical protein